MAQKVIKRNIVIDTKAIITTLIIAGAIWVALQMTTLILALFISVIIAMGMAPAVDYLVKKKIPRSLSVIMVFLVFLTAIISIGAVAFTPMVNQTASLVSNLPKYTEQLTSIPELAPITQGIDTNIQKWTSDLGGKALQTTIGAFSGVVLTVTIMVFTIYLLLEFESVKKFFLVLVPKTHREEATEVVGEIEVKIGNWIRGQITLMLIIGLTSFIGLQILGIDYALSLALIAGLLEIVPIIGPIISLIPALIVGLGMSPVKGVGVIGLYIIIQQLENNLIVPKVMQKAVGFNPLVTMLAILVGGELFGVLGALLAIPTTMIGVIVVKHIHKNLY